MKPIRLLFLLAGILVVSGGCSDSPTTARPTGSLTAVLDGQPWTGTAVSDVIGETIYVSARRTDASPAQWFNLRVVQSAPGVFTVVTPAQSEMDYSRYVEVVGGDVIVYDAAVTAGTLDVEQFDRASGTLRGTLSLTIQGTRGTSRLEQGQLMAVGWRLPNER